VVAVVLSVVTMGAALAYAIAAVGSSIVAGATALGISMSAGIASTVAGAFSVMAGGAIAGALGGAVGGGIMCGSDCARAGARSGAASGAIFAGAGMVNGAADFGSAGQILTRSTASGLASDANGGKFADGFRATLGIETLNASAMWMRETMAAQSCQGANNPNCTGTSAGYRGDGIKLGGARYVDGVGYPAPNLLGGVQGGAGSIGPSFMRFNYPPGSFGDLLVETFGGPHDFMNSFMYRANGNLNPAYASGVGGFFGEAVSWLNVAPASVFVAGSVAQPYTPQISALGNLP